MGYLGNFRRKGSVTMYKCICGADLKYLQSEDDGEEGIIEFYECDNCNMLIAISDNNVEEEEF